MDDIIEIKTQLADHEARIKNVEDGQDQLREDYRATVKLISEMETRNGQNMRDIRDELKEELARMTSVVDKALKKTKSRMPEWGRYVIDALIVIAGSSVFVWMGRMLK